MQTDSSCTLGGLNLQVKCCLNPGLPTNLHGEMTSDTSAYLHWHSAEGNDLRYDWELFRSDTVSIAAGTTNDTTLTYNDLDPNQCYFYTISVRSACSNDTASDGGVDVVYSNTFCYPYFVTLGNEEVNHHVSSDTLILPDGCYYDTIWVDSVYYEVVVVHESDLRVCYGNTAQICYSFSDNVNIERQLVWKTSYDSLGVAPVDTTFYLGDTTTHTHDIGTDDFHSCFTTTPITEDGYLTLEVYTDGHSLARAVMHIIVDSIPDVYLTVNGIDTSDFTVCEGDIIYLQGYNADSYQWTDSLLWFNRYTVNQEFQLTVNENNAYYVTGINSHHCSATDTLHLHINPKPDLVYEQNVSVCGNDSVLLHVEGISNYTWQRVDTIEYDTTFLHYSNWIWGFQLKDSMLTKNPLDNNFFIFSQPYSNCIDTLTAAQLRLPDSLYHFPYTDSSFNNYKIGYLATDHIVYQTYNTIANGTMDSLWVHPDRSTDYVVFGTDTNGCHCRSNAVIHVNVLDVPVSAILCEDTSLCLGDTLTAQAFINHTYYWWDERQTPDSLSNVFWTQYVPDSVGAHILHVQVTNQHGCHIELEQPFTVFPPPEVNATAAPDSICLYESTTLTATGNAITYIWDGQPAGSSIVTTPDSSSYFAVTGIDEHGCRNRDSIWVEVKYLPSREQVGDQHICQGDSVTIVTTGDAAQYIWSLNGNVISEGISITLHPADTTSYHLAYTYDNGCSSETDFAVNVHFYPTPHVEPVDTICRGQSIALHASGGNYYLWNDAARQTTDSILVTPDSTTTYTVMVYDTTLCPTSDSVTVPVIPYFNLFISGTRDSICQGQSVTFTVSGGDEYLWSNGSHDSSIVLTPDSTTIVSVSAVNHSTSCSHTVYDTIVVMPNPLVEVITTQDTLCLGQSTTLSAIGNADQYQWDINSTDSVITVTPELTTLYSVTATDFYGDFNCTQTAQQNINVNPLPGIFNIVLQHDSICYEDSTIIRIDTAFYNVQYHWSISEIPLTDASFTYHPNIDQPSIYTDTLRLTIEDQNGCLRHDTTEVTVLPMPRDTMASPNAVCHNAPFQLCMNGQNHYQWHDPISQAELANDTVNAQIMRPTTFYVRVTNDYGCSVINEKEVLINPLPDVSIAHTHDRYCTNQSYVLTATGAITYEWSTAETGSQITVSPTSSEYSYSVTGTDNNGCSKQYTIDLPTQAPPVIALSYTDSICYTDSTTINIHPTMFDMTYLWNCAGGTGTNASYNYHPSTDIATVYTDDIYVTVTDPYGCSTIDTAHITVKPLPRDHITGPDNICVNIPFQLATTGQNHYIWAAPISSADRTLDTVMTIIPTDQTFTVRVTNDYGCETNLSKSVYVNQLPRIQIESNNPYSRYCTNQDYTLTASGAISYVWSTDETGSQITVNPTPGHNIFFVTGTNGVGCESQSSITLQTANPPTVSLSVSPNDTICALDTVTISASGNYDTITWNTGYTDHRFTVNDLVHSTTYSAEAIRYDHGTPCSFTDTVDIYVQPVPTLHVTSDSPICSNTTGSISVSGANSYHWLPNSLLDTLEGHHVTILPTPDTVALLDTFTVIGEFATGCRTVSTIPYVIQPLPVLSIEPSSDHGICLGESITLQGHGGVHYHWATADNPQQTIDSSSVLTLTPTQTTTYLMWADNIHGCVDTVSIEIPVYQHPTLDISTSVSEICYGFTTTLTATSNGHVYQWNHAESLDDSTAASTVARPLENTHYTIIVTDSVTGCTTTGSTDIIVHQSPQISSDISTGVCATDSIGVTVSGATHYQWFYGNLTDVIHTGSYYEAPPITLPVTTYTVIGTDDFGCRDTLDIPVLVNAIPDLSINISSPGYLCKNGTNFLGISVSSNIPNTTFEWTAQPADPSMFTNEGLAFVSPDTTTTYTVTGYYTANGATCSAIISDIVTVYDAPNVIATGAPDLVCRNAEVSMSATGAIRYMWYYQGQIVSLDSVYTTIPNGATQYGVVGIDGRNCIGRDTVEVTYVDEIPTDSILSPTTICYNTPSEIRTTGRNHCYWYPQTGLSNISDSSVTVTLTEDVVYSVVITNEYGCTDTMTVPVHVNPVPQLVLNPDTFICIGNSYSFRITGGISYDWNDGSHNDFRTETPDTTTTYYVTGYNEYHCSAEDSITIRVLPPFDLSITASRDTFCFAGEPITLTAYGAGDNYEWSNGSRDSIIIVYPDQTTTYTLTAFNNSVHCEASTDYTIVQMTHPVFTAGATRHDICLHDSTQLFVHIDSNDFFQWSSGDTLSVFTIAPNEDTDYQVSVRNAFGCTITDTIAIRVHPLPEVGIISSDTAVCYGRSIQYNATGNAIRFEWENGDTLSTFSEIITHDGMHTLTGFTEYNCLSRDTIEVQMRPLPSITLSISDSIICIGDTTRLNVTGDYLFRWNGDNVLTDLDSNYIMVDPMVTSEYQVIATNNLGCQDSLTATVFVYDPLPLEITPDTAICPGSAVTMTATGSWNYLWNTGATNNTFTVTPTQTTQYSVSSTDQHGCVTSISSTITLYPDFDVALFHDRDTVCLGQEVHLWYSDNADHHQWNTGSTAESITVQPTENSIYTLTATNNVFGCQKTLYDTIIVLPYPEIDLNATNVCAGDTITVYATHSYPFQYSWETIPETVHIASGNNGQITSVPQVPTQFVYHATNHFCTLTDTFAVDVKPLPNIQIVASDTAVCFGNVVQLTAAGNAQQYQWSDGTIGSTLSLAETMSNAAYILTGTSEYGCISKDTTFVTIHPLPTGTLTGINHKICPGDTIPLAATNGYEYHWTPEAGLITNHLAQVLASPRVPTLYQVVLTNAYGCQDSLTTFVDVYDPLPLMISADTAVCFGNPATVSVSGSWNYLWNTGATNNTFTVTPEQTTQYSVSSTDLNGCVTTVSTTVTVYPDFEVEMLHARDTICLGESVTLWYTGSADHYQWSTGSTAESITVSPVTNSVYHLVATNYVNNCAKTLSDTIIVLPYPQFELNGPALICAGDTITVSASHSYPFQYLWETIPATTAFSPESSSFVTVAPSLPTQFVYHASNHICTLTDTLEIDVAPLPTIVIDNLADETCEQGNGAITVSANSEYEPVSYSWSTGSSSTTIDQLAQGSYSVTVTDALGCVNTMGNIEVENIPSPTVEVLAIDPVLNRTDGSITIDIGDHHGNYTIGWYDHEPLTEPLWQYENSTTANNVHTGTYWITVTDEACATTVSAIVPQIDDPEGGIWLPNCITASNTDGLNDKFYIVYSGEIEFKYIKFFNRWGELVYQSTDIDAKWDGSCNGKIYHNVVYNYIMEYVNYAGTLIQKRGTLVVL